MEDMNNYKDDITDELIARYLENTGDLSEYEKKIAEQWAKDHPCYYEFLCDEASSPKIERELSSYNSLGNNPKTIPFNTRRQTNRYHVAAAIAAIAVIGVVLSLLLLPSKNSSTLRAGMGHSDQTPWHNTELIPKEWNVKNGNLTLQWESNAPHSSMEISTDGGDSWIIIAKDKNRCTIQYDSSICKDTLFWYLTFLYENKQEIISSGVIIVKKP